MPSGPKMLSGGWSNVTRQYVGERRDSRISMVFVAGEFWFFIFFFLFFSPFFFVFHFLSPCYSRLFFVLQSFSLTLSSRSFVGRAHIRKLGDKIVVGSYFI